VHSYEYHSFGILKPPFRGAGKQP